LPPQDSLAHYRYLLKLPPPDVRVERDIGAPPAFIDELTEFVRIEMTTPDLRRRYRLRRSVMKLLSGVSGSGKTLAIHALWRRMYEVVSEVTGVALAELPFRVFKLRLSQVLSMWFGESDKNIDRFFEEIEQMALASEHVQRYLAGREPARIVQIPGRLVNVVTPTDQ